MEGENEEGEDGGSGAQGSQPQKDLRATSGGDSGGHLGNPTCTASTMVHKTGTRGEAGAREGWGTGGLSFRHGELEVPTGHLSTGGPRKRHRLGHCQRLGTF